MNVTRRQLLRTTLGTASGLLAAPSLVPASALGRDGAVPPSDRVTLGVIGIGWMGLGNLELFLDEPLAQVVAVCDVDKDHLAAGAAAVDSKYGRKNRAAYNDFREVLAREDIDAVCLSLPDHWHGAASVMALRAGKDVYGEKPLAHTLAEGRAICDAVSRYGRVWQTGSWQRSIGHFQTACELVRNGRIGAVRKAEVILPGGHKDFAGTGGQVEPAPPPEKLDYDLWLGPAPSAPYCPARVHKNWRFCLDYGGGLLMDWIGHHLDIVHWGLGLDRTGPVLVEARGEFPADARAWDAPARYRVEARYESGLAIEITGDDPDNRGGAKWIGDEGWIWVDRQGMDARPKSLLRERIAPGELRLRRSAGHRGDFLDCVRNRREPIAPCEAGLRSATPGYLGLISMMLRRPVRWNPVHEEILDDSIASRLLSQPLRSPWRV